MPSWLLGGLTLDKVLPDVTSGLRVAKCKPSNFEPHLVLHPTVV